MGFTPSSGAEIQSEFILPRGEAARGIDRYRAMAYSLIGSERVQRALDLGREPRALRESYGMTVFGQAALAARRLVEAGSRFVTVFWDEYGLAGSGWDTHWDHYNRMKKELRLIGFTSVTVGPRKYPSGRDTAATGHDYLLPIVNTSNQ